MSTRVIRNAETRKRGELLDRIAPRLSASAYRRAREVTCVSVVLLLCLGISGGAQSTTSLIDAVKRGDREAVRELLRSKPDVNAAQADGTTALHWAVRSNDIELVGMLLRAGAKATTTNRYGIAPITLAATNGSVEALDALLKAGASANTESATDEIKIRFIENSGRMAEL